MNSVTTLKFPNVSFACEIDDALRCCETKEEVHAASDPCLPLARMPYLVQSKILTAAPSGRCSIKLGFLATALTCPSAAQRPEQVRFCVIVYQPDCPSCTKTMREN